MTDIVDRLRKVGSCLRGPCLKVQEDAANEIERLRVGLEHIKAMDYQWEAALVAKGILETSPKFDARQWQSADAKIRYPQHE